MSVAHAFTRLSKRDRNLFVLPFLANHNKALIMYIMSSKGFRGLPNGVVAARPLWQIRSYVDLFDERLC